MPEKKKDTYTVIQVTAIIFVLLGFVLLVFGILVAFSIINISEEKNLTIGVVGIVAGILLELISIPLAKYLNKRCKSCHKLLYGAAYSWALIKEKVKRYKSNDGYELEYMLKYQIIFTCPHCGHVGSEKMDFTSKYNYSECETKILNYCMKKFGH